MALKWEFHIITEEPKVKYAFIEQHLLSNRDLGTYYIDCDKGCIIGAENFKSFIKAVLNLRAYKTRKNSGAKRKNIQYTVVVLR